jgi:hypothetical protein
MTIPSRIARRYAAIGGIAEAARLVGMRTASHKRIGAKVGVSKQTVYNDIRQFAAKELKSADSARLHGIRARTKIAATLDLLDAKPEGRVLARVLRAVAKELPDVNIKLATNFKRLRAKAPDGTLYTVRVTEARRPASTQITYFRFKPPIDLNHFSKLYFGGINEEGGVVVYKFMPEELRHLRTITLACVPFAKRLRYRNSGNRLPS